MSDLKSARAKISAFHKEPDIDKRMPLTPLELSLLTKEAVEDLKMDYQRHGHHPDDVGPNDYTCFDCASASICEYVFNMYSTNGDCLASK